MAYPEDQSSPMLPDTVTSNRVQPLSVIRVEFWRERQSEPGSPSSGGLMIVLEGKCHCHKQGHTFSLRAGDLSQLAVQAKSRDTVAPVSESSLPLSIDSSCGMLVAHDDPDQYLWGV